MKFNKMIACVVVLYNPKINVFQNIKTYFEKVEFLFVIDNSKVPNISNSSFFGDHSKVEYIQNKKNLGVAAALNIAAKKAIKDGYSYLLTMDQDSSFEEGSSDILFNCIGEVNNAAIYSPFHKNKYFTNPPSSNKLEEVSDVMTSGNILDLSIAEKVGFFREDFFIDYVDIEYCLRLRKNGYKIIRVNDSFLIHNEANLSKRKFIGFTVYPPNHSPIRWYYKIRNFFYLKDEYENEFKEYFTKEKMNIRNNIFKVFLYEKNKIEKIRMMLKGYLHFKRNIKGKLSS